MDCGIANSLYVLFFTHSVNSFIGLVQYLFTLEGVESFLSQRIGQDPLEKFLAANVREVQQVIILMCLNSRRICRQYVLLTLCADHLCEAIVEK